MMLILNINININNKNIGNIEYNKILAKYWQTC